MANTYELIASHTTASGGEASFTFSSIPSTYTDLKVVISARDGRAVTGNWLGVKFNGTTANYSSKWLEGNGSGAPGSFSGPTSYGYVGVENSSSSTANTFANMEFYIPNYASANYKSYSADTVFENNATAATAELGAGLWSDNSAITSITLTPDSSGSFVQYSSFYLYGIKNS